MQIKCTGMKRKLLLLLQLLPPLILPSRPVYVYDKQDILHCIVFSSFFFFSFFGY